MGKTKSRKVFDVISRDRTTGRTRIVKTFDDEDVAKDFAKYQRSSEKHFGIKHGKSGYNRTYQTLSRNKRHREEVKRKAKSSKKDYDKSFL